MKMLEKNCYYFALDPEQDECIVLQRCELVSN